MPVESTAPQYEALAPAWQKCRDAYEGQEQIIARGLEYVTPLDTQTPSEYVAYLRRGLYFNATARRVQGMVGASFRRPPSIEAGAAEDLLADATLTDLPFDSLAKQAMREVLIVGRFGIWRDRSRRCDGRKQKDQRMNLIKKLASRKLGVAVGGGVALSAASPEAIWPTAFVAAAYILGQAIVDTWGE